MSSQRVILAWAVSLVAIAILLTSSYEVALLPPGTLPLLPNTLKDGDRLFAAFGALFGITFLCAVTLTAYLNFGKRHDAAFEYNAYKALLSIVGLSGLAGFGWFVFNVFIPWLGCYFFHTTSCATSEKVAATLVYVRPSWWVHGWAALILCGGISIWTFVRTFRPATLARKPILDPDFFSRIHFADKEDSVMMLSTNHMQWKKFAEGYARYATEELLWTKLGSPLTCSSGGNEEDDDHKMVYYTRNSNSYDRSLLIKCYKRLCLRADHVMGVGKVLSFAIELLKPTVHWRYGMTSADTAFAKVKCALIPQGDTLDKPIRHKNRVLFLRSRDEISAFCAAIEGTHTNHFACIRARAFQAAAMNKQGRLFLACLPAVLDEAAKKIPDPHIANFKAWNFAWAAQKIVDHETPKTHGIIYFSPVSLSANGPPNHQFAVTIYPKANMSTITRNPTKQVFLGVDGFGEINNTIDLQLRILIFIINMELHSARHNALFTNPKELFERCQNCMNPVCSPPKSP